MVDPLLKTSQLPPVKGRYTADAPLGAVGWFRAGGTADVLYKPADLNDLQGFMATRPADIPLTFLGLLSNTIIRDGGVDGVVIRLGREFANCEQLDDVTLRVGAAMLDANVA